MSVAMRVRARARTVTVPTLATATIATSIAFVVLVGIVAALHGFLWGESQPMVQTILDSGAIKCLHDQGWGALTARCNAVGRPIGLTFVTGMPETMLGWAISWIPGVDAWAAHQVLNVVLDAVALAGGYLLLRRWSVVRWIALLASAVYLVSPNLLGINGFQYTFTGYTFLPLYVLLFLKGLDQFEGDRRRSTGLVYFGVLTFLMVFTDGYSYATGLILVGVVLVWWLWRSTDATRRDKAFAVTTFTAANVLAVAAYSKYVNVPATPHYPLGRFRLLGLDVVTLFTPQERLIWPSHLGYHPPTPHLWGDGSNSLFNYMGFGMLALVAWLVLARRLRHQPVDERSELIPLLVAGVLALFMSFGPALKIDSHVTDAKIIDLPLSKTTIGLPTAPLFAHVPPLTTMRAAYRFTMGFRFVLVFAAAYAASLMWRSRRRALAGALIVLASVEILPAPRFETRAARSQATQVSQVRSQLMTEFDALTRRGERILILPTSNDFLANAAAPFAGVETYNVGIDKNYAGSKAKWPSAVVAAADGVANSSGQADRVAAVLRHDADAVVVSYVDFHRAGTGWPAPVANDTFFRQQADALSRDPRFVARRGTFMTVLRARS